MRGLITVDESGGLIGIDEYVNEDCDNAKLMRLIPGGLQLGKPKEPLLKEIIDELRPVLKTTVMISVILCCVWVIHWIAIRLLPGNDNGFTDQIAILVRQVVLMLLGAHLIASVVKVIWRETVVASTQDSGTNHFTVEQLMALLAGKTENLEELALKLGIIDPKELPVGKLDDEIGISESHDAQVLKTLEADNEQ